MSALLTWVVTGAGAAVVLVALQDIFHTLWHPAGTGALSRRLMGLVWQATGRARRSGRGGGLAGPTAIVVVVGAWATLVVTGAAIAYWPHLPQAFALSSDLPPGGRGDALDAIYLSLVTTATLGFGDIVPTAGWLRIAVPLQALLGFGLLTAAVTWVLQLYPVLVRRRTLAVRLSTLRRVDTAAMLASPDGTLAVQVLEGLAGAFAQARADVTQYAETYFFRESDPETSLAATAGVAAGLAAAARDAPNADVRLAGALLRSSLDGYAAAVDEAFLGRGGSTGDVLAAYAADHGHTWRGR